MDLSKILSISGKPGLFLMVGEAKNNLVVESLLDGKKTPSFAHDRVSTLKEISVYTDSEDVALEQVFKNIFDHYEGKKVENFKKLSGDALKKSFSEILPDYDRDAVYVSDIKKIFTWYNLLLEKELFDFNDEKENTEEDAKQVVDGNENATTEESKTEEK